VEDAEEEDEAYPELDDQGEVILEETPEHDDQGEVLLEEIQTLTPDDALEYWSEYRKTWEQALKRTERRRVQRQRRRSRSPRQLVDPATLRKPTVKMTGGRRVVTQPHRNPMAGRIHSARRLKADSTPIDTSDIKLLNAANFMLLARQKGVTIMRTTMGELEEAVKEQHTIHMKRLSEEQYRSLLKGEGSISEWKDLLPADCHDFVDFCFNEPIALRRIGEEDAQYFLDKADKAPPTPEEILAKLPPEYHEFLKVAMPQEAEALAPHRSFDHKIELVPGSKLPYSRNRHLSPLELRVLKRWIDDNLAKGWIRPSRSNVASPMLLAKKPGGGVRICVDYRGLNNITIKNRYPLPLIRETLDAIAGARIFTKLDVIAAFNRVRVAEGHEWLTAFITRFGLYESLVTPFGLCGAPATFQYYINDLLFDLLDEYATAYLDDILIYSKTMKEHVEHVKEVLRRLDKAGLQVDIAKCEFHTKKTRYLGLIITPGGIEMDPAKVRAVQEWLPPATKRQLQRFLGFANFYRRFIKGFSGLTKPLHDLTKKTTTFDWSAECQTAFEELKAAFSSAPALRIYDWNRPAVVEVDASNWSTGGTLSQVGDDGVLYPVAYFSAKHSAQECNYDIYDKELLAIIKALEEWRSELEGAQEPFQILTDHKNLQTFATTKQLTPRHMRWSEFLSRFNFQITYRPGTLNTRPDALSRKPEDLPGDDTDDRLRARHKALIDPWKFDPDYLEPDELNALKVNVLRLNAVNDASYWNAATNCGLWPLFGEMFISEIDVSRPIDDLITESYHSSPLLQSMYEALMEPEKRKWPKEVKQDLSIPFAECRAVAGRIYYRDRLVISPADAELQLQLIHRAHTSTPAGHPGRTKTIDLMNRRYWWPGMTLLIRKYCQGCILCAKTKTPRSNPPGFLKPLPLPFAPWKDISVDYITPLPVCEYRGRKYQHIAVVVDRLTKGRHFIATETLEAEELADRMIDKVYSLHGCPDTVISDRGSQFVSTLWRELSKRLGVTLRPSSAYHPQTNGQTERINAELEQYLRLFTNWSQDDWVRWLPIAEFAGNNTVSETTGLSPFFANYGYHPRMGIEPAEPPHPGMTTAQRKGFFNATEIAARFKAVLDYVTALSKQAQDRYETNANRHRSDAPRFKPKDMVMLNTRNLKTGRPTEKLTPRWEGPFEVIKASSHAVQLRLPVNMKSIKNVFHVSMVRHWAPEGIPGQEHAAQDVVANHGRVITRTDDHQEEVRWKFKSIMDYRKQQNGRWEYLVEWEGTDAPSWQPAANLKGCEEVLWEYHDAHPRFKPPSWLKRYTNTTPSPRKRSTPTVPWKEVDPAPQPTRRSPRNGGLIAKALRGLGFLT